MSFALSPTRQQIYDFIVEYKRAHDGNSPSMREIANQVRYSTSQISDHLNHLVAVGMIRCNYENGNRSRQIEVIGAMWLPPVERKLLTVEESIEMLESIFE